MLVRSPVRDQTKWFLCNRLPVRANSAALQRDCLLGAVLCWMVGCLGREMLGKGVLAPSWANFRAIGVLFKTSGPVGEEVPRLRRPALGPLICPVGSCSWLLGSNTINQCYMDKLKPKSLSRAVVDQALETPKSGRGDEQRAPNMSRPSRSNRCYITFKTNAAAKAAFEAKYSLTVGDTHCKVQLMRSANVVDSDNDYCPNVFDDSKENVPKERQVPTPFWFVAYYREGRGNLIHASRYLEKEVGVLPMGHIKKYGKGVLIKAKDLTQAMMLLNLPCPTDSMFESIKPQRTFNYSKGRIYNEDLYEFSEEDILAMCPDNIQRVTKMKGSKNMIILTFYGSHIPDSININPTSFEVKPFVERPLQCFCCYEFGHGRRNCNNRSRCGNCSASDAHLISECRSESSCFYCRDAHPLRSRQCKMYLLEQDILHLANSQFISIGSARRQLNFRRQKDGGVKTYASTLRHKSVVTPSQPSQEAAAFCSSESVSKVTLHNTFSVLGTLSDTHSGDPSTNNNSATLAKGVHVVEVHAATRSPKRKLKSPKRSQRRLHSSSEARDSIDVPPYKATMSFLSMSPEAFSWL
ncbi:hypothetical protein Pmani_022216 [Petrolisthes manimaculis]|uniref:Uncharacterized protein n=1 Tax=Petrolisthes manimaculis TaxID=1843537 RepID=A0AAE1U1E2_9EUCA|nr:hypothetical protein Pmani_022216 [Petrolisthes manimaculis]